MHQNCPPGADSSYKWRVAEAAGKQEDFEPPALHSDVHRHLPIYEDRSRQDLLERCLGEHTQNANESFNSTVWRLAPKHLNSGTDCRDRRFYCCRCFQRRLLCHIKTCGNTRNYYWTAM